MKKLCMCVGLGLSLLAQGADSYTLAPFKPLHERLTWMSERCADLGAPGGGRIVPGSVPDDSRIVCRFDQAGLRASRKAVSRLVWKLDQFETAARWGDDPGNASQGVGSIIVYGIKLKVLCGKKDYDKLTIYQAGVMCSGHYGKLGFFHAMMSSDDYLASSPGPIADRQAQINTRNKILAWAAFSYAVATKRLDLNMRICATFRDRKEYEPLRAAFSDRVDGGPADCTGAAGTWTVRDFFSFRCSNPAAGSECGVASGDRDAKARDNAAGSLLHMIQDSYSQSHVVRPWVGIVPKGKSRYAIIACTAPASYAYYSKDNRKTHGKSDAYPWIDTASCDRGMVDDPVSAGATTLWMWRNDAPTEHFIRYLEERVFPIGWR